MGLDYPYTCPDIDTNIDKLKSEIERNLSNMLDECCPLLNGEQKKDFIWDYVEKLYEEFEGIFEEVRRTNEGMRKAADSQIDDLAGRLAEVEKELNHFLKQEQLGG